MPVSPGDPVRPPKNGAGPKIGTTFRKNQTNGDYTIVDDKHGNLSTSNAQI